MNFRKLKSGQSDAPDQPNVKRRSFMWKIGVAVPALLASVVPGQAGSGIDRDKGLKDRIDRLSGRLGILEDENAIRLLHRTYEDLLDSERYAEVADLFSEDGEVHFNGGIFTMRSGGVRRLYCERFRSGLTGRRIEPAPGFIGDMDQRQEDITIAPDHRNARASFMYSIQVGSPMLSDSTLVAMARLQGEGIVKWWEGGTYEITYVKGAADGEWKIRKLEYRILSRADYRPGKSHAGPISVPSFSRVYPEDPTGPDAIATV